MSIEPRFVQNVNRGDDVLMKQYNKKRKQMHLCIPVHVIAENYKK